MSLYPKLWIEADKVIGITSGVNKFSHSINVAFLCLLNLFKKF